MWRRVSSGDFPAADPCSRSLSPHIYQSCRSHQTGEFVRRHCWNPAEMSLCAFTFTWKRESQLEVQHRKCTNASKFCTLEILTQSWLQLSGPAEIQEALKDAFWETNTAHQKSTWHKNTTFLSNSFDCFLKHLIQTALTSQLSIGFSFLKNVIQLLTSLVTNLYLSLLVTKGKLATPWALSERRQRSSLTNGTPGKILGRTARQKRSTLVCACHRLFCNLDRLL